MGVFGSLKNSAEAVDRYTGADGKPTLLPDKNGVSAFEGFDVVFDRMFGTGNDGGYDSGSGVTDTYQDFINYFGDLATTQAGENAANRKFNMDEAEKNREFQHDEAKLQRDWYEAMSNSSYQRAVKDMKSAGINPILAYAQGGAASSGTGIPSGSAASYNVGGGDSLADIMSALGHVIGSITSALPSKVTNITNDVKKYFVK